jgi:FkbM family methyltransferase
MFRRHADIHRKYNAIIASGKAPLILDGGANIGASVVWFAAAYPHSHVIAIEPEQGNCELLKKNCHGLDYSLIRGGLGAREGTLFVQDPGISDWGFRLGASGDYAVPVVCARDLVEKAAADDRRVPFIAKIDIEGGEQELFSERVEWVGRFPVVIIELHDWLFPREARSRTFIKAISSLNVDVVYRNENLFCFNNDLL